MATVSYKSAPQFDIYSLLLGENLVLSSATSTKITLENGDLQVAITGTGFNLKTLAGSITGFSLYTIDGASGTPKPVLYQTGTYSTPLSVSGLARAMQVSSAMESSAYRGIHYLLSQNDVITGSAYDDEISGYGGSDKISGGDGDDYLEGDSYDSYYAEEYSTSPTAGNDTLDGGNGSDYLSGGAGQDSLIGGAGNDELDGGSGADKLAGGTGDDFYVVDTTSDVVTELSGQGTRDTVEALASEVFTSHTLGANVENMKISAYMNEYGTTVFTAKGNALGNKIGMTFDTDTREKLYGYGGNDRLSSGSGNDTLDGGTGNDTMLGGDENDVYYVNSNLDRVIEDAMSQWGGIDTVIYGVSTAGTASLGSTVSGLTNNIAFSAIENLTLGGTASHNAIGNGGANTLSGNAAANKLYGMAGNDVLVGNTGADKLYGDTGNDLLRGGAGNDTLDGGTGSDLFRFDTALGTATSPNRDTINNFVVADDTIQLENSIFTKFGISTTGVIAADKFKVITTGGATDSNDYIVYNKSSGAIYYDATGSTNGLTDAVQVAIVGSNLALTNADFHLV